jgi:hypothetical protein
MANFLAPIINGQQFDANGDPLSSGEIFVYLAGTSTPATTYTTQAGGTPNTFPIDLNTLGVNEDGEIWLVGGSSYKFVIKDAAGVTLRTLDNMSGINDNTVVTDQWLVYQAAPTYVSATSFTLAGDQTQTFQVGRRLKSANTGGTVYSTITGSVYSSPNTTVTVRNDSGTLDSGLSQVSYGVMSVLQTSLPGGMINYGQCLISVSGGNIILSPYNGNRITINGSVCVIPAAGVGMTPSGTVAGTVYNIYAFMSGSTLTLEASTTAHATDATTGVEIKSGDPTRTLVGKARPIAGPTFVDTDAQRLTINWFNRRPKRIYNFNAGAPGTNSLTPVALVAQADFLTWGDAAIPVSFVGSVANNTANAVCYTALGFDTTTAFSHSAVQYQAYNVSTVGAASGASTFVPAEGYHFVCTLGQVGSGAATWQTNLEMSGVIQG